MSLTTRIPVVLPEYQIGLNSLTFLRLSESIDGMLSRLLVLDGTTRASVDFNIGIRV